MSSKIFLGIVVSCLLFSCRTQNSEVMKTSTSTQVPQLSVSKIIFLHFKINKKECLLLDKKSVDGTLKSNGTQQPEFENYIQLNVRNNNRSVQTIYLKHPLYTSVEFTDEHHNLNTKELVLEETDFFVRLSSSVFPLDIEILEQQNKQPLHHLNTIHLD